MIRIVIDTEQWFAAVLIALLVRGILGALVDIFRFCEWISGGIK